MKAMVKGLPAILCAVVAGLAAGCAPDAPFKFDGPTIPERLNDGWEIASPEEVGLSTATLGAMHGELLAEDRFFNAKSLLVVKDGKLVFETYPRTPKDRDRYGHVQSVTKSVTSLVFGMLYAEGYVDSLDRTLYSIMPEKFPDDAAKRSITLRHLLTMTSGLSFDNDVFSVEMHVDRPADPAKYILDKPTYADPGAEFYYRDCDPQLISYAIGRLSGRNEEHWAAERLFGPMGITDYYWEPDHTGATMGAHGLHLRPRDMAKIGQLVLNGGRWNGEQLVDSSWIDLSTRKQFETDHRTEPHVYDYGFYWWLLPRYSAFTAWGHGGNFIFVVPGKRMVIVMTSLPDTDDDVVGTTLEDFEGLIAPLLAGA